MANAPKIDCIVVGYRDIDFQSYAMAQKRMQKVSGAYRDAKHNSVLLQGKRITYMDLLNRILEKATGQNPKLNVFEVPSLGVTYLTSFLRRRSFNVEMVGFFNYEKAKLAALLADSPTAVAITTTFYVDFTPPSEIVRFVRQHSPSTKVIMGGPFINAVSKYPAKAQEYVLKNTGADVYVCDSQGEKTLADILAALRGRQFDELAKLPNLVYTTDNRTFQRTRPAPEANHLDNNAVDYGLFRKDERIFDYPVLLRTARSCPFHCSFCNFPAMAGKHVVSELEVIERQLRFLHDKGVRFLVFIDDTFNVPLPRFKNLLRMMIRNRFEFDWMSFFRCSNADDETFDLMQESGCKQVFLGIESGDQTILNNMQKFAKLSKYREGIQKLNERGVKTYASIICGFPGETERTFKNTLAFLEDSKPTFFNIQLYYHDVSTPVHREVEKYGLEGSGYSWKHRTMSWQEAADWTDYGFENIQNSIPTTLYGFSVWAFPYLISRGLTLEHIKRFCAEARSMLVSSFDDQERDFLPQQERLAAVFEGCRPQIYN